MTNRRKIEIARVREEGRKAAAVGKHRETNPYRYADRHQWWVGYDEYMGEVKTIYTVPHHVGENVEVPKGTKVTYY